MSKTHSDESEEVLVLELEGDSSEESEDEELSSELINFVLEAKDERQAAEQAERAQRAAERIDGVVIGRLLGLTERGPQVGYSRCPSPNGLPARAAAPTNEADVGRRVALMFENGEPGQPILIGLIHDEDASLEAQHPALGSLSVHENEQRIEIKCAKPIGLRCGDASIVLTPKGRILLKGKYVLSRAAVTNRIRGGSVRIN